MRAVRQQPIPRLRPRTSPRPVPGQDKGELVVATRTGRSYTPYEPHPCPEAALIRTQRPNHATLRLRLLRHGRRRVRSFPFVSAGADPFIRTVAASVSLQTEQPEQSTGIVDHRQPTSRLEYHHCCSSLKWVRRLHRSADKSPEPRDGRGIRSGFGDIRSLDRRYEPSVQVDDQGHVEVVVAEKSSEVVHPGERSQGLGTGDHDICNAIPYSGFTAHGSARDTAHYGYLSFILDSSPHGP